jgi:hypothetical protein
MVPLPMACFKPCNTPPFFAFTMPLYLAFKGRLLDLAYGISRVWALAPKFQFQVYNLRLALGKNMKLYLKSKPKIKN